MQPLLELVRISKAFQGNQALDGVDLTVHAGEVVGLLGENGAGKSTLMKVLSGVWPFGSYEGEVRLSTQPGSGLERVEFNDTRDAHRAGIAMIHQELSVFPELSVGEHLELGQLPHWIKWSDLHRRAQGFLDGLNLGLQSKTRVGDLSIGGRQLVEIARALYRNANILVFDEPTSALTEQEVLRLYGIVERLRSEGKGIIYITHRLDEVFRLADRMVVLRDGKNAGEVGLSEHDWKTSRARLEPRLISWMVGRSIDDVYSPKNSCFGDPLMKVENLSLSSPSGKKWVDRLSFSLKKGEVLGLAGLLGAGRSEVFETLFGVLSGRGPRGPGYHVEGHVWVNGRRVFSHTPAGAIEARMGFVSEDRKGSGLILRQSIQENMSLAALVSGRKGITSGSSLFSTVSRRKERELVQQWMRAMRVKATDSEQSVGELSGGNQQKVVLAKWLLTDPEVLFLDEPTRGIDVGAKVEFYQWVQKLASEGMGMIVASSEMPELLGICHRILVLREGRCSAEMAADEATQEDIMRAASL